MRLIGLTGGIATGKSTVARLLREDHGVQVIDADLVARQVVMPGSVVLGRLVDAFGPDILTPEGALDRAAMRHRITQDAQAREALEAITHPAIRANIVSAVQHAFESGAACVAVEAALMVETGSYKAYPELWVVSCAPETQLRRLVQRDGMAESDARALIGTQLPLADKEAVATHVIRNDGDLESLGRAVTKAFST